MVKDLKEHDIIIVTSGDVEYISSPVHSNKDTFSKLPVGTEGTVVGRVTEATGGCYAEFPYIQEHHPHADSVLWLTFDEFKKKGS